MSSYSCENATGVEFESNKASVRQGFPDSVLRINYFLGALLFISQGHVSGKTLNSAAASI